MNLVKDKTEYRILVIEDNRGDFALVEDFLFDQIESPEITRASTCSEAVQILANHKYDVILLDLSLPDKTGAVLITEILTVSKGAPVIVFTGYTDFAFGVKSLSLGISDYILKEDLTSMSLYKSIVYNIERKHFISALETSEMQVRSFAKQLNFILEEERARIAREIHDDLGQQLSGLKMSIASLNKFGRENDVIATTIDSMLTDVDQSIKSLRLIANELRPVIIDKLGLFAAIEWLASRFEARTGVICRLRVPPIQTIIEKTKEINIFRIIQEVFTNISKHANASMVTIVIKNMPGKRLLFQVTDNGVGVSPEKIGQPLSMGLLNIRERAKMINADLAITRPAEGGTTIELTINLNDKENIDS